ncbi:MAG: hypothetical protein KGH71_06110, partial [Candidatus Micrarchaeota archaeon]|nr:hypothetical protein [Candidatus Micrarchaeota archaeon]
LHFFHLLPLYHVINSSDSAFLSVCWSLVKSSVYDEVGGLLIYPILGKAGQKWTPFASARGERIGLN